MAKSRGPKAFCKLTSIEPTEIGEVHGGLMEISRRVHNGNANI